jgi:hypothetical protein
MRCRILNFKIFDFILKFKKIEFVVLFIARYVSMTRTGRVRDFSHRKVKISHFTVNPPTEYKQIIISQLLHGEISRFKGQKRVDNLGDFFPKKANLQIFWEL